MDEQYTDEAEEEANEAFWLGSDDDDLDDMRLILGCMIGVAALAVSLLCFAIWAYTNQP